MRLFVKLVLREDELEKIFFGSPVFNRFTAWILYDSARKLFTLQHCYKNDIYHGSFIPARISFIQEAENAEFYLFVR